jgi:hypothetical protein
MLKLLEIVLPYLEKESDITKFLFLFERPESPKSKLKDADLAMLKELHGKFQNIKGVFSSDLVNRAVSEFLYS